MYVNQTFFGLWDVAETQRRIRGEWIHEYDFKPGEWSFVFDDEGRFSEIFRPEGMPEEATVYDWTFDDASGIISLHPPGKPREVVRRMFFDASADGPWLYSFEDAPHIRATRDIVIDILAHERWKILSR